MVAAAPAAAGVCACHDQHDMEGASSQFMNVAGKQAKPIPQA
jgi:hypothetical protein